MTNISIKELNQFIMKYFDEPCTHAYQFAGITVTQTGNILYSPMNITRFLVSEFTVVRLNSYKYLLVNKPNAQELRLFLKGLTPLTNMVMNFNL
jgi:hypothetical protein